MMNLRYWMVLICALPIGSALGDEREEMVARVEQLAVPGPHVAEIAQQAQLQIPAGCNFFGPEGARLVARLCSSLDEPAAVVAANDWSWIATFNFANTGYVSDAESDQLDAAQMLESIQHANNTVGNAQRRAHGLEELYMDGWLIPPQYNRQQQRLEWCLVGHDAQNSRFANFNTRLLGREGVMHVLVSTSPENLQSALSQINQLLDGFRFNRGHRWAEFRAGDKVAAYGLTALITGGAATAAAKSGVLAKFGKFIAAGLTALVVAIYRSWRGATASQTGAKS